MSASVDQQGGAAAAPAGRRAGWLVSRPWAAVVLLMAIGIVNFLDRVLPSILAEPIKQDLALSDTFLGVINGVGFLLVYALACIPLAHLSDRGRYNIVITVSLGLWSAMTLVGGWVASGWQLAVSRMGVALGEAGATPAAHAYITRHIAQDRRARALSLYMLCVPIGSTAGFIVGGFLGEQLGWRQTFILMGVIGLVLALAAHLALGRGTAAAEQAAEAEKPPVRVLPLLRKRSLIATLAGSSCILIGGYATTAFAPAFLMRAHGMSVSDAGVKFGVAAGIASATALLAAGWIADRLSARDPRWLLGVVIVMILACLPLSITAFLAEESGLAVLGLAANYVIPTAYSAPVVAALHRLSPLEFRARASALLLLCSGIFGGLGPLIVGAISDALTPEYGAAALGRALLILVPTAYGLAAVCYAAGLVTFRRELADEA
jgi:MFS family permease